MSESNSTLPKWKLEEQWVSRVIQYSTERNNTTGSANQIIGPPKIYPQYGRYSGAWTLTSRNENEFIIVEFERAVYPEQINIYETFSPGAIVEVLARNSRDNSEWETIWKMDSPCNKGRCSRIFSIPCTNMFKKEINQIRLNIDCSLFHSVYQIDSIKLFGHLSHMNYFYKEFITNFKDLLNDNSLTDVNFQLDNGQLISSYRNILNIRCIYFNQLFQEYPLDIKEPIRIRNISSESFYQILYFIFTDTIQSRLTFEIYLELMRKADEFFLSEIYTKAFKILKKIINKTNVFEILIQSDFFSEISNDNKQDKILLQDVANLCRKFIEKNRRDVYVYDNMRQLTKDMLLQLIQLNL